MDKVDLRCVGGPYDGQYFSVPSLKHGDPITLYGGGTAPNPIEYTAFKCIFRSPVSALRGSLMVLVYTDGDLPLNSDRALESIQALLEHDVASPRLEILFPVE